MDKDELVFVRNNHWINLKNSNKPAKYDDDKIQNQNQLQSLLATFKRIPKLLDILPPMFRHHLPSRRIIITLVITMT